MECTFCRTARPEADLAKGPHGLAICGQCVGGIGDEQSPVTDSPDACSFCNQKPRRSRMRLFRRAIVMVTQDGAVRFCSACRKVARELLRSG